MQVHDTVVPVLWFEEGLDELGDPLVEAIGAAVIEPPKYKRHILSALFGLLASTLVIAIVAAVNLCVNRRKGAREEAIASVRKIIQQHSHPHPHPHGPLANVATEDSLLPMLPSSSGTTTEASTAAASRVTTATHSRNASDGSSIPIMGSSSDGLSLLIDNRTATSSGHKKYAYNILPKV